MLSHQTSPSEARKPATEGGLSAHRHVVKGKSKEAGPGAGVCSHLPLQLAFTNISAGIAWCPLSVNRLLMQSK